MLDLNKKYYVCAGAYPESVIASWASENNMELVGEDITLPTCSRAYELDVRNNDALRIKSGLLGSGRPSLLNNKRSIGLVECDRTRHDDMVVICPEIRDR